MGPKVILVGVEYRSVIGSDFTWSKGAKRIIRCDVQGSPQACIILVPQSHVELESPVDPKVILKIDSVLPLVESFIRKSKVKLYVDGLIVDRVRNAFVVKIGLLLDNPSAIESADIKSRLQGVAPLDLGEVVRHRVSLGVEVYATLDIYGI